MTRLPRLFACLLLLAAGPALAKDPALDEQARQQGVPVDDLRVFSEVMERIQSAYIEEVDDKTLLRNAIRGMLNELDPHSAYLTPDQFKDLEASTSGEFGGLGIEVTMENGFVKVVSPLDNTPASKAGLKAGDLILKIDDQMVKQLSLSEAVDLMRGEPGSEITLSVLSKGENQPRSITLERAVISIESVRHRMLEPGYGYVRITQFQSNTGEQTRSALEGMKQDGLQGLVLDLRNNPGGVLGSAIDVADLMLDDGLIVYTEGRAQGSRSNYAAQAGDLIRDVPVVVLVNSGSASASEIVAGALQDHGRAIIMGQRTFGKGSVQTVLPLHDDRALKLTTARYYTPDGRSIQAEGIEPDIEVTVDSVEMTNGDEGVREADLPRHLVNPEGHEERESQSDRKPLAKRDYALYQALSILKGIHLSHGRIRAAMEKKAEDGATEEADSESEAQ
jgi:carboxyl-terminal processing protease